VTFTEIQTAITDRLNLTSTTAQTRVGNSINRKYREITASLGIKHVTRRTTLSATMTPGVSTVAFTGAEKVIAVFNRNVTPYQKLDEVTIDELHDQLPYSSSDTPTQWALATMNSDSVTIEVNATPQTALVLYADAYATTATLSGTDEPVFPESFHDILVSAVLIDEYMKVEKPSLSEAERKRVYGDGVNDYGRIGQLRHFIAVSTTKKEYQNKNGESSLLGVQSAGGSGGSGTSGALSYTQTGLITFNRGAAAAPFAVSYPFLVTNLNADLLDGLDSTAFRRTSVAILESDITLADNTTDNVTSTKHGFAPKSPADATMFLNGAATPAYALVKDSDLSTSDITTNNVTTAKHGFITKAPNDTAQVFRGDAAWGVGFAQVCQGRLTLTTGTPVTSADVTGATNIFFAPYGGNRIALYTSSAWKLYTFTELTLALGTLTNDLPYDVFVHDSSGTLTLTAVAWSSKTVRATALTTQDGVLVKTGSTDRRYLGTFHTTATTTTEDSLAKRLLWNYYNRVRRPMRVLETTDSWTYTTATLRQANGAAANQLAIVVGVAEVGIEVRVVAINSNSGANVLTTTSIGEDSTSATIAGALAGTTYSQGAGQPLSLQAGLTKHPAIGYHFYAWLEYSGASGTTTWYGDNGGTGLFQSGIMGSIEG
jgi:hypothetical protein